MATNLYVLHCLDRENGAALREAHREAHASYMRQYAQHVVLGGPLLDADGQTRIGIMVVLDFPNKDSVQTFVDDEPYHQAGLFATTSLTRFQGVRQRPLT